MLMAATTPQDDGFPTLADALDPRKAAPAMMRDLQAAGHDCKALKVEVERVRLKPGRKALIGYRLTGIDALDRAFDQRVMMTLWPEGQPSRLPVTTGTDLTVPDFGPPAMQMRGLQGSCWFFPNDRKIDHIARLIAQGQEHGQVAIVHYVPEQGCTIRVGAGLYGKVRADDRGAIAASIGGSTSDALRLAPIISYDDEHRILWQQAVAGAPVSVSALTAHAASWAPRIAKALCAFHALPSPVGLKELTSRSIATTVAGRIARTAIGMPDLEPRLEHCARRLDAFRPAETPLALAHCDLHPTNLLWDGSSFAIIDLDTAALAPVAADHGTLVASIAHRALVAGASTSRVADMIQKFRGATAAELDDLGHFDWFVAASLLGERLYRCGTRLKSPQFRVRKALVDLAEGCLDNLENGHGR
jgi:aminoglycoside phosphotransferase